MRGDNPRRKQLDAFCQVKGTVHVAKYNLFVILCNTKYAESSHLVKIKSPMGAIYSKSKAIPWKSAASMRGILQARALNEPLPELPPPKAVSVAGRDRWRGRSPFQPH